MAYTFAEMVLQSLGSSADLDAIRSKYESFFFRVRPGEPALVLHELRDAVAAGRVVKSGRTFTLQPDVIAKIKAAATPPKGYTLFSYPLPPWPQV